MLEDKHTLADVRSALSATIELNGWLILTFHHIDDKTFISTPPKLFQEIIAHIQILDVDVVTMRRGSKIFFS